MLSEAQRDVLRRLAEGATIWESKFTVPGDSKSNSVFVLSAGERCFEVIDAEVCRSLFNSGLLWAGAHWTGAPMPYGITDAGRAALEVGGE
jgi:hypothetical protein